MDFRQMGIRVLAADDDEFMRLILSNLLKESGYNFFIAEDGLDFMDEFTLKSYDIVLLDINMPGLDGWDIIGNIRKVFPEPKRSIPVIALTGHKGDELISRLKSSGFNYYLSKPFRRHDLDEAIRICLDSKGGFIAMKSLEQKQDSLIDTTELEQFAEGNKEFFNNIIETFLSNAPKTILNLRSMANAGDWKGMKEETHRFAPQLNFIGARLIAGKVEEIEQELSKNPAKSTMMSLIETLDASVAEAMRRLILILNQAQ